MAWVATVLLVAALLPAGGMKLIQSREAPTGKNMEWAADFPPSVVRLIGGLEVLAVVGLVLPPLLGIAEWLAVAAAVGVILLMFGAAAVHGRRKEMPNIVINAVIVILAALVIWGRVA